MFYPRTNLSALLAFTLSKSVAATSAQYHLPSHAPTNAKGQFDKAPVGVSIEFFAFPEYFSKVPGTQQCLENLGGLFGKQPPIRIGGTTQDRALYNPNLAAPVDYYVPASTAAPENLTYGPAFMDIAAKYHDGDITLGLNRRLDNLSNTIAAAQYATSKMENLYSIELGNEPELYSNNSPIVTASNGIWTPITDANSQTSWQASVGNALRSKNIIQAGVRLEPQSGWSIAQLVPYETSSGSAKYVRSFGEHSYPQTACNGVITSLPLLMSHAEIVNYTKQYYPESAAARSINKAYFLSETNSASCGGGGISPTFGAALWIVDYVLQSVLAGAQRLYFHQGTIGNCAYCWWGRNTTYAPYYGAFFVSEALARADSIQALDDGTTHYAAYAIASGGKYSKLLLYNSEVYINGTRPSHTFTVNGLLKHEHTIRAKRLTAPNAYSRVETGQSPTIGGMVFGNTSCLAQGKEELESIKVVDGAADFSLFASEALLVYI